MSSKTEEHGDKLRTPFQKTHFPAEEEDLYTRNIYPYRWYHRDLYDTEISWNSSLEDISSFVEEDMPRPALSAEKKTLRPALSVNEELPWFAFSANKEVI